MLVVLCMDHLPATAQGNSGSVLSVPAWCRKTFMKTVYINQIATDSTNLTPAADLHQGSFQCSTEMTLETTGTHPPLCLPSPSLSALPCATSHPNRPKHVPASKNQHHHPQYATTLWKRLRNHTRMHTHNPAGHTDECMHRPSTLLELVLDVHLDRGLLHV